MPTSTTTWNPSDKSAGMTLGSTNHVASTTAGGNFGVRGTVSRNLLGKFYLEYPNIVPVGASGALGFAFATDGLGSGSQLYVDPGGFVHFNGGSSNPGWGSYNGLNVSWAINMVTRKAWCRFSGGNWLNQVIGSQDPANGIGGVSFAAGALFPYVWLQNNPASCTINAGDSAFAFTAPVGFSAWDQDPPLPPMRPAVLNLIQ